MAAASTSNHLVQINTRSQKPLKVIFEYLALKFKVPAADIDIQHLGHTYWMEEHGEVLLEKIVTVEDPCNLTYDLVPDS